MHGLLCRHVLLGLQPLFCAFHWPDRGVAHQHRAPFVHPPRSCRTNGKPVVLVTFLMQLIASILPEPRSCEVGDAHMLKMVAGKCMMASFALHRTEAVQRKMTARFRISVKLKVTALIRHGGLRRGPYH